MQLFAGSSEIGAIREIRGVDDQRITLPMSYRVPLPQPDVLRNVRTAVGGDDAGGVVRLVKQRHVSRPLHNLQQVAFIGSGQHRNSSPVPYDATLASRPVQIAVEFVPFVFRGDFRVSFPRRWQHGGDGAFRPNDERCTFGGVPEFACIKTVQFEIITHSLLAGGSKLPLLAYSSRASLLREFSNFL